MEVKEKSKKRELIKSIAIVFLAVMLLLTFFSNTIMNRSLPEVSTKVVYSGSINAKIRGSGTVTPNEAYEVIINQTREVRSVCVRVGDTVAQGDLLFVLGDVESQELKDAQEQLKNLNLDYQEKLLNLSLADTTENRDLQKLRQDLEKAIQRRDDNQVTDAEIAYAKGDLAAAKSDLAQISLVLEELNALMADNEEYVAAKAEVDKWTAEVEKAQAKVDDLLNQLTGSGGSQDIAKLEKDVQDALAEKTIAESEMNSASKRVEDMNASLRSDESKAEYVALVSAAKQEMINAGVDASDPVKLETYVQIILSRPGADASWKTAYDAVARARQECANAEQAYQTAKSAFEGAVSVYNSKDEILQAAKKGNNTVGDLQQKLALAQNELGAANYQLNQANYVLNNAEGGNENLKRQIKEYEAAKRDQDYLITNLNELVTELDAKKTAYDAAVEQADSLQRQLEDKLTGQDIDDKLEDIGLQRMRMQIEKQKELVAKYQEETTDTEIKANVSGTISAINVSAGKDTSAGSPMAVIDVVDRGYTIKVPVTNTQAKQVKVGDAADVTNYYWGNDLKATLEAIAPDPAKPGQGKLLIFRVTGEIDPGTNITLSIGQKSANFDTIVPKSALRSDTNGDFVLVMTSKSTPLGNRYYATRVDVQILAQDDTSAAVSGVGQNEHVITTSSKPLEAGTQVRMVDNA